ncbi:MAG: tRNA epoxyqueuosine(34) reductase QueG [Candidatus Poribacteria bacterium]|nr:tRNA epoxyqueuosine(34) reductase QueG [Candidatus Poribacteria bacterium]
MANTLTQQIQSRAYQLGFELVGITPAEESQTIQRYKEWIANGYAGKMGYLERHLPLKEDTRTLLQEAKSVISLAMNYYTLDPPKELAEDPSRGQISRYAWGDDYHDVIRERLLLLVEFIKNTAETELKSRVFVDSGPILEREYAQRAKLGWIGKNTNLINWRTGSWYFLAEVLVSIELDSEMGTLRGSCGTCTKCIEACPTDAFVEPNLLDSRLCISYLTIELKDSIPKELRPKMGNLIFGCDICQEVCPWNSKAIPTSEPAFQPHEGNLAPELLKLVGMTQSEFSEKFKGSPIKRAKRRGFLRNVLVAIGNWGARAAIPALKKALVDEEPLVRSHAAWAMGQIGGKTAEQILQTQLECEHDNEVILEIQDALQVINS